MRWPTRVRCAGSEIPGLGWKNLTQELQICVAACGGRRGRGLVLKGLSSQGFRRHKAAWFTCAALWPLTRYVCVRGLGEARGEAELKWGENRIRADLKSALKLWGIERCTEGSVVGWKCMVKFPLKPSNLDGK